MSKTGANSVSSVGGSDTAIANDSAFAPACTAASVVELSSRSIDAGAEIADAAADGAIATGGSRRVGIIPKKSAAPSAAKTAMHGTSIRPIDVALMLRRPWLNRRLARVPILGQFVCVIKIFLIGRQSVR
jgi:hypothetical protein